MKCTTTIFLLWIMFLPFEAFGQADNDNLPPLNCLLLDKANSKCIDLDQDKVCDSIDTCIGDAGGIDYDGDGIYFVCDPDFGNNGPACKVIGQLCTGPRECCSNSCVDDGSGIKKCQELSGCRPQQEFCTRDADCCSYLAAEACSKSVLPGACEFIDGAEVGRCVLPPGALSPGELCGEGASNNCCAGGSVGCYRNYLTDGRDMDFERCFSTSTPQTCRVIGETCAFDEECCTNNCVLEEIESVFVMRCQ